MYGRENFLPRNFKLITDTMHGWKLDHENFIREKAEFGKTAKYLILKNFRIYSMMDQPVLQERRTIDPTNDEAIVCRGDQGST